MNSRRTILQETLNKFLSAQLSLSKEEFVILKKVGEYVVQQMNTTDLHGFPHVLRVLRIGLELQKEEGGNLFILILSTLLHDVGRDFTPKDGTHAEKSAEMTKEFLDSNRIHLHEETSERIIHSILAHSFSANGKAETIESKILSDADKIDALGAVGIYRAACFQYEHGTGLMAMYRHFFDKLLLLPDKMYTPTGRKIADERIGVMKLYIHELEEELHLK
ncbi:MAG: HD domain-containing protein [Promethearchaeota archaeon]|nr:MAG: HD domain-containing protein [Candidatus Lokiarchaeota archaeon]